LPGRTLARRYGTLPEAQGRDLFDLWLGITESKATWTKREGLQTIHAERGNTITAQEFEQSLFEKISHHGFAGDLKSLLIPSMEYDPKTALAVIQREIIARMSR